MSFGEVNSRFIQWYKRNGGYLSDKISFKDYSDERAGRGMVAVEDINVCGNGVKESLRSWHFMLIHQLYYKPASNDSL